jgi:8-hydroxy-5-deazaflavin:NADPH oxidoreductase
MRIAVIGKGNIGGTLGSRWRAAGHDVVYGARDGSGQGPGGAPARSIGDALKDAEVVLLAVPGQAVPLPLWFALVRQNGGNRRVALRIVR